MLKKMEEAGFEPGSTDHESDAVSTRQTCLTNRSFKGLDRINKERFFTMSKLNTIEGTV